jgi:predicted DNA binding CopG/RHH family protein
MRKEYDFGKMKGRRNPYAAQLKKQVTIRLAASVIDYFKALAEETGIPYQSLINLYLLDCVATRRKPGLEWSESGPMVADSK